ncbi:MAG: ATP-binding protein [Gaiellales bacterium]
MHELVEAVDYLNLVAFLALSLAAAVQWWKRRDRASFWALLAFAAIAVVVVLGRFISEDSETLATDILTRFDIAVLLLFPYLLYRFTTAFNPRDRRVDAGLTVLSVIMITWTFALPDFPASGEPRPASFIAYLVGFLLHWTLLSVISSVRLWRAGRGQPTLAKRRMRLLASASALLTAALFVAALASEEDSPLAAAGGLLAFVSSIGFYLGLAPPQLIRLLWRRPEQRRLQEAIQGLMTIAKSRAEVVERVLAPMADIVGARAVAIRDSAGVVLGAYNVPEGTVKTLQEGGPPPSLDGEHVLELDMPDGSLVVWTTPYAPFFGDEEFQLLRTLGALTAVALDRVRLFEQEQVARLALEQADELKTNFVALAAHELRTPLAAIHGFVQTLNRLGERLDETRQGELLQALERQTERMSALVEQLLDLSRLDAEAVDIVPARFRVAARVDELTRISAGAEAKVDIDIPAELELEADPTAFDRIVGNLITNAVRYGEPPVVVRAQQNDRHFRLIVEDHGHGVPIEFVPELFERFRRSPGSRERTQGTGLGLAIARSFARAHGGDLLYEDAAPHGARFQLVLPT